MHVIDNFFNDPYRIRKVALESTEWFTDVGWPGYRFNLPEFVQSQIVFKLEAVFNQKLSVAVHRNGNSNAYFQYVDKSWGSGACHFDGGDYIVIIFLNPHPPSNTGTEVYSVKGHTTPMGLRGYKIDDFLPHKRRFYTSERNPIQRFFYEKKLKELNFLFKDPCIISNQFNRTLVFDSSRIHRAQDFFGNKLSDSRLTISMFLNVS